MSVKCVFFLQWHKSMYVLTDCDHHYMNVKNATKVFTASYYIIDTLWMGKSYSNKKLRKSEWSGRKIERLLITFPIVSTSTSI